MKRNTLFITTAVLLSVPVTWRAGGPWFIPLALYAAVFLWSARRPDESRHWFPLAALIWTAYTVAQVGGRIALGRDAKEMSQFLATWGMLAAFCMVYLAWTMNRRIRNRVRAGWEV